MENGKKSKILVVAFILGIGFLFLWGLCVYLTIPGTEYAYDQYIGSLLLKDLPPIEPDQLNSGDTLEETLNSTPYRPGITLKEMLSGTPYSFENYKKMVANAGIEQYPEVFWWFLISLIISIPAVLLNFFGWFKNRVKNILIAAILYLVTLNIPSAVLCFICFRKLKKPA